MAYVNVKDWSVDQVTEWLKGLDNVILQYTTSFLNNAVTGHQILNLRADDLEHLGVKTLGHQEIILEAVEHLRNFHFALDKENLQTLALKLSCASNSLYKELLLLDDDCNIVQNQTMSDVHNIITTVRPLVYWLERSPFAGDKDYMDNKTQLLQLSMEMATIALRGIFSEKPVRTIRKICEKLAKMADHIIQEISDPMILQPASLDLATLKKKEQEVGFCVLPNNHAIHQIADIKYGSPAHASTKIEEGDEIVQVNYQTVVGWQTKKVLILLQESPPEIVLTLKKRPRHSKIYGQIYMKPYRLPSKKRDDVTRWNDRIPTQRLLPIHNLSPIPSLKLPSVIEPPDVETEMSSSDSEPPDSPLDGTVRMYPLKPRPILQRRYTITGATPTNKRQYPSVEQYWQLWKNQAASTHSSSYNIDNSKFDEDSMLLRDKSASCNLGMDIAPRPTTVIGLSNNNCLKSASFKSDLKEKVASLNKKRVNFEEKKDSKVVRNEPTITVSNLDDEKSVSVNSLASLTNETIDFIDEGRELTDRTNMIVAVENEVDVAAPIKDAVLAEVKIHDIIKKFDEQQKEEREHFKPKVFPRSQIKKPPDVPQKPDKKPMVPPRSATTKLRGRLDKSHSTPAYDLSEEAATEKFLIDKPFVDVKHTPESIEEPFTETKYELGIPIVEIITEKPLPEQIVEESKDLPPKPPPRTFGVEIIKPVYPIDSPKPASLVELTKPQVPKTFEFPDVPTTSIKLYSNDNSGKLKNFEPKTSSTPITKTKMEFNDNELHSYKTQNENKISPTNSIVRAMIYSNKNKGGKKKNTLIAKRRKVTVNDLNPSDIQGFLFQRLKSKHNQNIHWEKRWFVLLGSCLYGFKTKEDFRAACLIFLSGFTVALASEVKSKKNAFKVYHDGTCFYFSAEDPENLQSWIEMVTAATLNNESVKGMDNSLYSETDDENDSEKLKQSPTEKGTNSLKKFGSLKKFTSKKPEASQSGSTSLDRKWLFNKPSSAKNSLPVPTAQFRSYRKIPSKETTSVTTGNFTSHVSLFGPRSDLIGQSQNISVPNLCVDSAAPSTSNSAGVKKKTKPINYVHASNPSLCNIGEFNVPTIKSLKQHNDSLAGFITLEEFMNKQQEERKTNPYNEEEIAAINLNMIKSDVVYGEVPIRPSKEEKKQEDNKESSSCFGKRLGSLKRNQAKEESNSNNLDNRVASTYPKMGKNDQKLNRSLPRTHKMQDGADSKNLKKYEQHYSSAKNLFKERSYEMIYCPETTNDVQFAQNRTLDDRMYQDTPKKIEKIKKQHSFNEKTKRYTNKVGDSSKVKLKSAIQYTPMSLPLQDQKSKPKLAFELNLDDKSAKSGKLKQIFGKQNTEKDTKKEKTFLGSPRLRRALFKKHPSVTTSANDISWPTTTLPAGAYSSPDNNTLPLSPEPLSINISPHADYPGLEYPPVFEPETYSLADPQSSLSVLRKQGK